MNKQLRETSLFEVKSLIGQTIQTTYGPSLVVGFIYEDGETYVHLKEFGYEDYSVHIDNWRSLCDV